MNVFLRLRRRLRGDDGKVAALAGGIEQARAQQRRLRAAAAVDRERGGAGELDESIANAARASARDLAVPPGEVA